MCDSGYRDVDIVITTRELGRMIREAGIDFKTCRKKILILRLARAAARE